MNNPVFYNDMAGCVIWLDESCELFVRFNGDPPLVCHFPPKKDGSPWRMDPQEYCAVYAGFDSGWERIL